MPTNEVDELVPGVPRGLEAGLRNYWYPILQSEELPGDSPVGVQRLGEDLVVWRSGDGAPRVFRDRCPHRSVKLSLGRILRGQLQCIFHGLRFDGDGQCVLIPWERDDSPRLREVCAQAYPAEELGGYIWTYLGNDPKHRPPPLKEEVPEELLNDREFSWFRLDTQVWDANWLLTIDGSDSIHAVILHDHSQAVANERWEGGRAKQATVPVEDRRVVITKASYGMRAVATDLAGRTIHHGHLLEDLKGKRFNVPCLTTNPISPVPGAKPYAARLWQFPVDYNRTLIVRYVVQRAASPEERENWKRLFYEVVRPRLERVAVEDAMIAKAQGDLVEARSREYLFEPDRDMYGVRQKLKEAFLTQAGGKRLAPTRADLAFPV